MIDALYLSPHFDDAVLSCGGQIFQRTQCGERVAVVTVCAAPPPAELSPFAASLHARWSALGNFDRAAEDRAALAVLDATPIHLNYHDCIYRRSSVGDWLYDTEESLFGELSPLESPLVAAIAAEFERVGPLADGAEILIPRAIGKHVDHQLVRVAAEQWLSHSRRRRLCYADYPYAESVFAGGKEIPLNDSAKQAKVRSLRAYASQLTTFWASDADMVETVMRWPERVFD